jgi:hypothetical protein
MSTLVRFVSALLFGIATIALGGIVGNAARADATVTHVTVTAHDSRGALTRSEYWIDESRSLARVVDATPDGPAIHATGPDWALDLPAAGDRAYLYRTLVSGAGPTASVRGRLFYYRDSHRAGRAQLVSREDNVTVVRTDDGAVGAFDGTGIPVWETRGGSRTVFQRSEPELLSARDFSTGFFSDALGRRLTTRVETTLAAASKLALFAFRASGPVVAGERLTRVLVTEGDSDHVRQQINVVYGGGVEVVQSLLAAPTAVGRSGGTSLTTALGTGALFGEDDGTAAIVLVNGTVATSIFAPSATIARQILATLEGAR